MTEIDADPSQTSPRRFSAALADAALTRSVIGGFYEVYNALGHGFLESVYAEALRRELVSRRLRAEREVRMSVRYKGDVVGIFRADIVVGPRLIVELKATPSTVPADRRQLLNYLRATRLELGLLPNFGHRATFHRVIATNPAAADPRGTA